MSLTRRFSRSLLAMACMPVLVAAQSAVDIAAMGLASPNLQTREGAVVALRDFPPSAIPASVRTRLIVLLDSADILAQHEPPVPDGGDSLLGEYIANLSMLVVGFNDTRALHGLCITGALDVSRDIQIFVASHAAESLPFLEQAFANSLTRDSVLETWGRILAASATSLTVSQLATIRQHVLAGAELAPVGFMAAVEFANLVELVPVVHELTKADSISILKSLAIEREKATTPRRAALANAELVRRTQNWATAFCLGATGARRATCHDIGTHFDEAIKQLDRGQTRLVRTALEAIVARSKQALARREFTTSEAALLIDNMQMVLTRVW